MHRARRERARKKLLKPTKFLGKKLCRVEDCLNNAYRVDLCDHHYRYYEDGKLKLPPTSRSIAPINVGPCIFKDCLNGAYRRGLCSKHYQQWQRGTDKTIKPVEEIQRTCSVEGCNDEYQAHGFCNMHYSRLLRDGELHRPWDDYHGSTNRERYLNYLKDRKKHRVQREYA